MRTRSMLSSLVLATASVALLVGCSGKPENSPAIRTKFAQYDKMSAAVDSLTSEVQILQTQLARLAEENSELRAFAPTVNGTPAIEKINALEARLVKIEGLSAQNVMTASAPSAGTTTTDMASAPPVLGSNVSLDEAPLAAAPAAKPAASSSTKVVAQQQETKQAAPAPAASSFREQTNRAASATTTTSRPAAASSKPARPAAAPAPASRGAYHTIETGDTLQAISSKYKVSIEAVLKANRIPQGAKLARGQRLFIPPAN